MLFNSIEFLIYFAIVFFVFYYLNGRNRKIFLLIASCFFYMRFIPSYIIILFVTIVIDFVAAIKMEKTQNPKKKKFYLVFAIVNTCLVLGIFKYYNFFIDNINFIFDYLNLPSWKHWGIILPIGLSFHTFQSLSYVIDVYRGKIPAERSPLTYSLYVMMFPQLVAGPIERADNMLPQLKDCSHKIKYSDFSIGLSRFFWGLFKKVVIADTAALFVDSVYGNYEFHHGANLLVATFFFGIQIYCDFSGYSDMAIGMAQMLGFKFRENFSLPYFSKDITEFWRRWHMSLSSWLREYLYFSFGGNRLGKSKTIRNLFLTMLIGGLWHGASWNFVIWGALNGVFLSVEKIINVKKYIATNTFAKLIRVTYVFLAISLTWVFFRANTFSQAWAILSKIFFQFDLSSFLFLNTNIFATIIFSIFILFVVEYFFLRKSSFDALFYKRYGDVKVTTALVIMIFSIILLGNSDGSQFIYFQF